MGWREEYEAKQRKIETEVRNLMAVERLEDLDKRFFKDFDCINFIDEEKRHEFDLASKYHKIREAAEPGLHDTHEEEPMRCYHVTTCKCGFSWACDSSD